MHYFTKTLLLWYNENKRDLPWRKSRDPYKIWLSEIMLQQTRVETVIEKYDSFLSRSTRSIFRLVSITEKSGIKDG